MMTLVSQLEFPTALVTASRAQYWRTMWLLQLQFEIRKPKTSLEIITQCEEHIAMTSIAMNALREGR